MKKKVLTIFSGILAVIFCSTALITGCSSGSQVTDLVSLVKMTPEDIGLIIFIDVKSLRSDKDLDELYNEIMEGFEDEIISNKMGINIDNIQYIAMTEVSNQVVRIGGDFDLDAIREYNLENDYEKGEYKGIEIWYGPDNALAIHNDTLIIGDEDYIKDYIEIIKDPKKSIYELNENIRDIIDNLPDGLFSAVSEAGIYPDANAMGMTLVKVNADTFKASGVYKFDNEEDAKSALNGIKEDMESDEISDFQINRSGKLVKLSAEIDIDEAGLFW